MCVPASAACARAERDSAGQSVTNVRPATAARAAKSARVMRKERCRVANANRIVSAKYGQIHSFDCRANAPAQRQTFRSNEFG